MSNDLNFYMSNYLNYGLACTAQYLNENWTRRFRRTEIRSQTQGTVARSVRFDSKRRQPKTSSWASTNDCANSPVGTQPSTKAAVEMYIEYMVDEWLNRAKRIASSTLNIMLKDTRVRMF